MHVTVNNLFNLFSIDALEKFFAQQIDQEEGLFIFRRYE